VVVTEAEIEAYRAKRGTPRMSEWTQHGNTWRRTWAVETQTAAALVVADAHGAVWGLYGLHEAAERPAIVAASVEEAKAAADASLRSMGWGPTDADLVAFKARADQTMQR